MTASEIRAIVIDAVRRVAPEVDPAAMTGSVHLRDDLDLDSMDFLNVMLALHERLHVDIPEADYAHLYTLDGAVAYLADRCPAHEQSTGSHTAS